MPYVRLTARPVLCICARRHEHQCAQSNNCELCFHDHFSPVMPLPPQARSGERRRRKSTRNGLNAWSACAAIFNCSTTGSHKVLDPDLDTTAALAQKTRKALPMIGIAAFHPAHTHDCGSCVVRWRHLSWAPVSQGQELPALFSWWPYPVMPLLPKQCDAADGQAMPLMDKQRRTLFR
jgi:hypothetical protein